MVIKKPQECRNGMRTMQNTKRSSLADSADNIDSICCATTDNTSMLIRLNSSKQPQAPVYNIINFKLAVN